MAAVEIGSAVVDVCFVVVAVVAVVVCFVVVAVVAVVAWVAMFAVLVPSPMMLAFDILVDRTCSRENLQRKPHRLVVVQCTVVEVHGVLHDSSSSVMMIVDLVVAI